MKPMNSTIAALAIILGLAVGVSLPGQSAAAVNDHTWETLICGNFFPVLSSVERCDEDALGWAEDMAGQIPGTFSPDFDGNTDNAYVTIDSGAGGDFCANQFTSGTVCAATPGTVGYTDHLAGIGY